MAPAEFWFAGLCWRCGAEDRPVAHSGWISVGEYEAGLYLCRQCRSRMSELVRRAKRAACGLVPVFAGCWMCEAEDRPVFWRGPICAPTEPAEPGYWCAPCDTRLVGLLHEAVRLSAASSTNAGPGGVAAPRGAWINLDTPLQIGEEFP